jgi:hypothetical protein
MHWFFFQVTILVHITYHHNVDYGPKDLESKTITNKYHYYMFNDNEHDTLFV